MAADITWKAIEWIAWAGQKSLQALGIAGRVANVAVNAHEAKVLWEKEDRSGRDNARLGLALLTTASGTVELTADATAFFDQRSLNALQSSEAASSSQAEIDRLEARLDRLEDISQISGGVAMVGGVSHGALMVHEALSESERRDEIVARLPTIDPATQHDPARWELAYSGMIPEQYGAENKLSVENEVFKKYTWTMPGEGEERPTRFPLRINLGDGVKLYEYGYVVLCFQHTLYRELGEGERRPSPAQIQAEIAALWSKIDVAALDEIEAEMDRLGLEVE